MRLKSLDGRFLEKNYNRIRFNNNVCKFNRTGISKMIKTMKNLSESFIIGWDNLYFINKIILSILIVLTAFAGLIQIVKDITWLINKIF